MLSAGMSIKSMTWLSFSSLPPLSAALSRGLKMIQTLLFWGFFWFYFWWVLFWFGFDFLFCLFVFFLSGFLLKMDLEKLKIFFSISFMDSVQLLFYSIHYLKGFPNQSREKSSYRVKSSPTKRHLDVKLMFKISPLSLLIHYWLTYYWFLFSLGSCCPDLESQNEKVFPRLIYSLTE